jgi:single-strand DNA-binding protein
MSGVNKVLLVGRLGRDPELRFTPQGERVGGMRLATNRSVSAGEGERRELTDWHDVVLWGKQAETVAQHSRKGDLVCVEGRLQTRSWEDPSGEKRYRTEVVAEQVRFLSRAAERAEERRPDENGAEAAQGAER